MYRDLNSTYVIKGGDGQATMPLIEFKFNFKFLISKPNRERTITKRVGRIVRSIC